MIAMLINCVAEKTIAHSDTIWSVAFSPDGTKIVSGSTDGTIKVWESGALESTKLPLLGQKLTPVGLSGRQTGAGEPEDVRAQPPSLLGGVFPGQHQDCVRIVRQDDQSLGFKCAASPENRPSLAKTDACWLAWQTSWRC
jgi:WD40 repeat protein